MSQLGTFLTQIGYEMNKDYISKNLCEYRFKTITTCFGSCFLKKEVKKNHEKDGLNGSFKSPMIIGLWSPFFHFMPIPIGFSKERFYFRNPALPKPYASEQFQPPARLLS